MDRTVEPLLPETPLHSERHAGFSGLQVLLLILFGWLILLGFIHLVYCIGICCIQPCVNFYREKFQKENSNAEETVV